MAKTFPPIVANLGTSRALPQQCYRIASGRTPRVLPQQCYRIASGRISSVIACARQEVYPSRGYWKESLGCDFRLDLKDFISSSIQPRMNQRFLSVARFNAEVTI